MFIVRGKNASVPIMEIARWEEKRGEEKSSLWLYSGYF